MGLFPTNNQFFELLNAFTRSLTEGADLFVRLFEDFDRHEQYAVEIKEVELVCDKHSAGIIEELNNSFITPLDREDIYVLAVELDDIMDMINMMARTTVLFNVQYTTPHSIALAKALRESVVQLSLAFSMLRKRGDVRPHIDQIRALEEEGDRLSQEAIQKLFTEETNPIEVIKWLKMYEDLEHSLDRCKKVAKVLAGILVKNA